MAEVLPTRKETRFHPPLVMERTSLITALYVAPISNYNSITLDADGYPNVASLANYFEEAPLVQESSQHQETEEETDQGNVIQHAIRCRIYRDSEFYLINRHQLVMLYFETANEERYFLGSPANPLLYLSNRNSGVSNTDSRDTELNFRQIVAV